MKFPFMPVLVLTALTAAFPAHSKVVFSDSFDTGASPAWGNQSGDWRVNNGTYDARIPGNGQTHPFAYTDVTAENSLTDFTVYVTVKNLNDGGVWLRSAYNAGQLNGVLLVTGGNLGTFDGFYWHIAQNGVFSAPLNTVAYPGAQGSTQKLKIVVKGSTYSLFVGKATTPLTSVTTTAFTAGSAGLYDFSPNSGAPSPRGQTFDNFKITSP